MNPSKVTNIDEYISLFPADVQMILEQVREAVKRAAPEAEEKISYGMPAFTYHGNLVYFAAFKNHIDFYSLPHGNAAYKQEISKYKSGKGSVQFPLDQPMPIKLIIKIAHFRVKENVEKKANKKK